MKILRFTASWCQPCKMLAKTLEDIENKPNIEVIDIDENSHAAIEYGVRGVPTMIKLDENNNVISRMVGNDSASKVEQWIND